MARRADQVPGADAASVRDVPLPRPHGPEREPARAVGPKTELCCAFFAPPRLGPDGFERIELPDGSTVHLHAVVPIYRDEMDFKLKKGADALRALLEEHGVTELIDPARPTVAPPKRGLFRR